MPHAVIDTPEADRRHPVNGFLGVDEAERTGRGIAVEQLTGIRARVRLRKAQRAGVVLVQVDPAYTSQTCHACGHVDKRNRRSQAVFHCLNIATRGVERWGEVRRPHAAPTLAAG
ncbi:zinc ribbon domain-containing protein [Kibdelosporangium lantanae]|uniref:Zinc ribbon domain-containing protein n=1 Tax=Kibdelosporangium lantanae TaxID=1497396 RepID=A0ABW3MKF7_9PSEU